MKNLLVICAAIGPLFLSGLAIATTVGCNETGLKYVNDYGGTYASSHG